MRKRKQLAQKKDGFHNLGSDDLLSRLPDEILVSIMSSFSLKEVAATSVLSRRWRYLWCQTSRLVFEDRERWSSKDTLSGEEKYKYMSWVDHIIHQHKSPTIDKFKIRFGFDENAKDAIDKWIKYAISKNVQTLELSLLRYGTTQGNYCFPYKIFDRKCGYSLKRHSFNDPPVMEIKFLKSLILRCVDVDDEVLKKILNTCPNLEHLYVVRSYTLVKPEIHGKGLALKSLGLELCPELESVEICDSNIEFFNCDNGSSSLRFDNLQKLEKICISKGDSWKELNDMFSQISCIPYLQVLELYLHHIQGAIELHPFPMLQKLKHLIISVLEKDEDGFSMLPSLLEACPNLQRLTIKRFTWPRHREEKPNRGVRQMAKTPHQSLEVVEMVEYRGWTSDLELFMYFLQNCVALKKLVIEPTILGDENAARYHAQQELKPRTPVGVELVIL